MQKSDIIEIINGKKNLDNKELEKVKIFIDKYPYFETLYNIYIRNSFKISQDSFEDALTEYSVFVNNKRKMVDDIFAENKNTIPKSQSLKNEPKEKITQDKEQKVLENSSKIERKTKKDVEKKSKIDEDIFDPLLHERQKVAHKLIVDDFVVVKAEKYGDLRKLLKTENISEEDFWQKLQDEADQKERLNLVDVKTKKNITENKVVKKTEQNTIEISNVNNEAASNIDETKKDEDKINSNKDISEDSNKKDDIFSKIAKLKSKKLQDFNTKQKDDENTEVIEEKTTEITEEKEIIEETTEVIEGKATEIAEEKEIIEETTEVIEGKATEIAEEKEIIDETTEVIEEKTTEIAEEKEIIEETTEVIEEKTTEIAEEKEIIEETTEVVEEKTTEIAEEKEIIPEIVDEDANLSAADKILLKLKSKKTKSFADTVDKETTKPNVSADDILKKLRGEANAIEDTKEEQIEQEKEPLTIIEDTKEEIIEQETEPLTIIEDTKEEQIEQEKEPLTIIEDTKEEIIEQETEPLTINDDTKEEIIEQEKEPLTIIEDTKEEEDKPIKKKQTAADLILEKIRKRKEELPTENLIDKFLTEQPYIDRKREPENTEDLSVNSAKETEVATERLAEIYALQGLKEKAILTYEKLILKYPEKNTYFATKIQELKNK